MPQTSDDTPRAPQPAHKAARRRPRQRRSQAKVDAILRAAIRVLAREGYGGASTVKIARAAGVGVGTLYDYFPDKDAIFAAYVDAQVEEIFTLLMENLAARRYTTVAEAVHQIVATSVQFTVDNRDSLAAMVGKIPGAYDGDMLRGAQQQLYAVSEAFYREHGLAATSDDARRITYVLSNAVTGFFVRMLTTPDLPLTKAELTTELQRLIMGYLAAPMSATGPRATMGR